ncbi:MAG: hypothetical protein M3188_08770 [Actinomycetota bacterium]|nr:hypothetical protein [Actinomycetota bacterium]
MNWETHAEREQARYRDGSSRLPDDTDARQRQLLRIAMAAGGAGLARLMQGREAEARGWLVRSAERYRESYADAPTGSWGRLIGVLKARILAGDWEGARRDAEWVLDQRPADSGSAIGRYAAALAAHVLGDDDGARRLAASLGAEPDAFPPAVAAALAALAEHDAAAYADAVTLVLRSFEERDAYLEDVPVADTVLALEALAERRGVAARPRSPLLPV